MDEKINKKLEEIQKGIAKMIADATGIPVLAINKSDVDDLTKLLLAEPKVKENLSEEEIRKEASGFISRLYGIPPKDGQDAKKRIEEFIKLLSEGIDCEATIILDYVHELPIGLKISDLEIVKEDLSGEQMEKYIKTLEEKKINFKDATWIKFKFKTYKPNKFLEDFYRKIEKPLSAISFVLGREIDPKDLLGIVKCNTTTSFLSRSEIFLGWVYYESRLTNNNLDKIAEIYNNQRPSQLERKFMNALEVFWLSKISHKREISFIILSSALETLIMSKSDKDYLNWKLAEKCAFLLSEDKEKIYAIYKRMKDLYNKRSKFMHEGDKSIEESDLRDLENFFFYCALKIIEFIKEGFKTIDKVGAKIEKIKFGVDN